MKRRDFLKVLAAGVLFRPWRQIENLLATLTTRQKVGQLFMLSFAGDTLTDDMRRFVVDYHIGGVALFDYNISTPANLTRLSNDLQNLAAVPLLLAVDQEGGKVQRLRNDPFSQFPNAVALGAADDLDLTFRVAQAIAEEMRACGLNMNLAPVLDVNTQPRNPIINVRAFGSDPLKVAQHGAVFIQGLQGAGIVATGKHFPGHGGTVDDSHYTLPTIDTERTLLMVDAAPFSAGIRAEIAAMMTAHIVYPALDAVSPATFSHSIANDLLRDQLGFQGVVISDALTMNAVRIARATATDILRDALNAGVDILAYGALPDGNPPNIQAQTEAVELVNQLVQTGQITPERLDQAVGRILALKARFGILDWQPLDVAETVNRLNLQAHETLLNEVAARSITLYRDLSGLLPLAADTPIALIYPDSHPQIGAIWEQAFRNSIRLPYPVDPLLSDVERLVPQIGERIAICATLDTYRYTGQVQLVNALPSQRTIVIAAQSPYDLLDFPDAATYLMGYGVNRHALTAIRDVLLGNIPAVGRLPLLLEG